MDVTGCWLPYLKHSGYAWVAALHRGSFHSVHKDRLLSGASEKNLLYLLRCRDLELIEIYNNNKKDHLSLSLHQELPFDGKFQSAFLWDTTFITWDNLIILKKIFVLFFVSQGYGYTHLSAGDLLREERAREGSEFGQLIANYIKEGKIVPVEITINLLRKVCTKYKL